MLRTERNGEPRNFQAYKEKKAIAKITLTKVRTFRIIILIPSDRLVSLRVSALRERRYRDKNEEKAYKRENYRNSITTF